MEKYCVSLELAQKMKELGFPQDTEFYWQCVRNGEWTFEESWNILNFSHPEVEQYAAPNVGELSDWLPSRIEFKHYNIKGGADEFVFWLGFSKNDGAIWYVHYSDDEVLCPRFEDWGSIRDKNLANAQAKMLIYLVENKLLDVKDLV